MFRVELEINNVNMTPINAEKITTNTIFDQLEQN